MTTRRPKKTDEEINELREQVNLLKRQNKELMEKKNVRGGESMKSAAKWRTTLVVVLLIIGLILTPISMVAFWLNRQIVNTDAYVETVAPLSSNPVIQGAVATFVTDEIFKQVNVNKLVKESLPPEASFLAVPIAGSVKGFTRDAVLKVIKTPAFNKIWADANRLAHKTITGILIGEGPVTTTSSGKVTLDLGKLVEEIKSSLNKNGITILNNIPTENIQTKFTLFQSETLAQIKTYVSFLNSIALFLPFVVILFIGAAIAISTNRRKAILWTGIGASISMIVLAIGLVVIKSQYLNAISGTPFPKNVATAVFDTIILTLRSYMNGMFLLGLIVAAGAIIVGPAKFVVQFRTWMKDTLRKVSKGMDFGPAGDWINRNKVVLRAVGIALSLIIIILVQLSPLSVLLALLGLIIYIGVIEFLGQRPKAVTR